MPDRVLQPVDDTAYERAGIVDPAAVAVVVRGDVEASAVERGRAVVAHVATLFGPALYVRLKLSMAPDPAVNRPARAEAIVDIAGRTVRAHVRSATVTEAIDALDRRLRDRLAHFRRFRSPVHAVPEAPPGEWRHGLLPTPRPAHFDRPAEERRVLRRKTSSPDPATADEAAFDMEAMDFDFHLFRHLATGGDAAIWRNGDGGYRMQLLDGTPADGGGIEERVAADVAVEDRPAPRIDVDGAVARLDSTGDPFVFFADAETGRGAIVYRRYDGHYGLLTTA